MENNMKGMQVTAVIKESKRITLEEDQIKEIVRQYIKQFFGFEKYEYLTVENGILKNTYEAHTSHRFNVTDDIRKATEDDVLVVMMLGKLHLNY